MPSLDFNCRAVLSLLAAAGLTAASLPACTSNSPDDKPSSSQGVRTGAKDGSSGGQGGANVQPGDKPPAINLSNPVAASQLRERALAQLIKLAKSSNPVVRANAIEAAAKVPSRTTDLIRQGLADPSPGVRSVAAVAAGRSNIAAVVPQIRPLVDDSNDFVRLSARYALSKLGEPIDITPIGRAMIEADSVRVRSHAAFLIGELGNPTAVAMLRDATQSRARGATKEENRLFDLQAAEAMVKLGDDKQVQVIRAALFPSRPEDLEATALAAQILGQLRDQGSVDRLIFLSEYRDPDSKEQYPSEIRLTIAQALAGMGLRGGEFIADEYAANPNPLLRAHAATVYGTFATPEAVGRLSQMLDDPAEEVRIGAVNGVLTATERPRR
jgi:HEAT repeat protein